MEEHRWPKIVAKALAANDISGSWVDNVRKLVGNYSLQEAWNSNGFTIRQWKHLVRWGIRKGADRRWLEEIASKSDIGEYGQGCMELKRAGYIQGSSRGEEIRREIKKRCEWGEHWA